MKRMTIIAAALCLIMLTTVGAGAVAAKQENPRQAGASSIYFYDVAPTDTHGKGKLQINVDKHTFEFNGQGFDPSAQIALRAKAADSADYVIFATGKATPSGNLHIAGTWDAATAPAEVVGGSYYPPLYSFYLHNIGGFVAKVACEYSTDGGVTWHQSGHTDGTAIWTYKMAYLDDLGVPDAALVKIHVIVVGGIGGASGKTGSEVFQHFGYAYNPQSCHYADYTISGTIFKNKLEYEGYH